MSSLPDFLVVGCAKGGTTSLYEQMRAHPQLYLPLVKETYYLLNDPTVLGQGVGYEDPQLVSSLENYQGLYKQDADSKLLAGEVCNAYLYCFEQSITRIRELLGDPKIIIVLREPVARAYSGYLHLVREGLVDESFEECLLREVSRKDANYWWGYHVKSISYYAEGVRAYLKNFSQVKVLSYDLLNESPQSFYQQIYSFLGVETVHFQTGEKRLNATGKPRSEALARLLREPSLPKSIWKKVTTEAFRQSVSSFLWACLLRKPLLNEETAKRLKADFAEDVKKLDRLVPGISKGWGYDEV